MPILLQVGLATALWCALHSLLITHRWRDALRRRWPRHHLLWRLVYVTGSTVTFAAGALWVRTLPERLLWDWPGPWQIVRWAGIAAGAFFLVAGSRAHDGRAFLGLRQWRRWRDGRPTRPARLNTQGILARVRHPWYSATLLLIVFALPLTDLNLVWRGVFFVYTIVGTLLEERKLASEFGAPYTEYRRRVPRFFPRP